MNDRRVAPLVLLAWPLACTASAPRSAAEDRVQEPWVTLAGAGSCESRMARDPAGISTPITWEACASDPTPGCQRFVIAEPPEGEYIHFRGVEGVHAAVLRADWSRGQATRTNDRPSDPIRIDSYYDEDGRPLLALQTKAGVGDCPLEAEFSRRSAAILSTDIGGAPRRVGPAGSQVEAESMVVFAGPPEAASEWSTRRAVFTASDAVINAKPGILPDGRVVLFQRDEPQVILTDPGAGTWRGVRSSTTKLWDALIVGDRAVLQMEAGELRLMRFTGAGADVVHAAPGREFGSLASNGVDEVYWLELPQAVPDARETWPRLVTLELRAAKIPADGEPLAPRTLARFVNWHYSDLLGGSRPFTASFHSSQLPHLGVGPGGVFVHVGRETEDVVILARPQDGKAWAWAFGDRTRTPGLGTDALVWVEREERARVAEFRGVMFYGERFLALQYQQDGDEIRRWPLASLQVPAAELHP
jgi:hypothetical protein